MIRPSYVVVYDRIGELEDFEEYYGYFSTPVEAEARFAELVGDEQHGYRNARICQVIAPLDHIAKGDLDGEGVGRAGLIASALEILGYDVEVFDKATGGAFSVGGKEYRFTIDEIAPEEGEAT